MQTANNNFSLKVNNQNLEIESDGKRKRNKRFRYAKDLIKKESLTWSQDLQDLALAWRVKNYFLDYLKDVGDKVLCLHNGVDKSVVVPYLTRAHTDYIKKAYKKLRPLQKISVDKALFLTLTTNPANFVSLDSATKGIKKNTHKLITWLNKRLDTKLRYISVLEFTSKDKLGNWTGEYKPHIHILIFGISWLWQGAHLDIKEKWEKYGQGMITWLTSVQAWRGQSVFQYIMKYITKVWDIRDFTPYNMEHISLLWALCARTYTCSRGLLEWVIKREKQCYEYLGCFSRSVVERALHSVLITRMVEGVYTISYDVFTSALSGG